MMSPGMYGYHLSPTLVTVSFRPLEKKNGSQGRRFNVSMVAVRPFVRCDF